MQQDPGRQWFIYENQQEQGPYSELELQEKLLASEVTIRAYAFTEGMADWTLIEEIPHLKSVLDEDVQLESSDPDEAQLEDLSKHTNSTEVIGEAPAAEPTTGVSAKKESKADKGKKDQGKETKAQKKQLAAQKKQEKKHSSPKKKTRLRVITAACILAVMGYLIYDMRAQLPAFFASLGAGTVSEQNEQEVQGEQSGEKEKALAQWEVLRDFSLQSSRSGGSFMLGSKFYMDGPLVLKGAVSKLINSEYLNVAVFPNPDRNLMGVARLWKVKVPLMDQMFVVGPFFYEKEANLPPGNYILLATSDDGTFLGETRFDVGTWPSSQGLIEHQRRMQQEAKAFAQKELKQLMSQAKELDRAWKQFGELKRLAFQGASANQAWQRDASIWLQKFEKALSYQRQVVSGPMYFSQAQAKMLASLEQMEDYYSRLANISLTKSKKKLRSLSADFEKDFKKLEGDIMEVANVVKERKVPAEVAPLGIDPEIVKAQLLGGGVN